MGYIIYVKNQLDIDIDMHIEKMHDTGFLMYEWKSIMNYQLFLQFAFGLLFP